jgi:hypothetical protein
VQRLCVPWLNAFGREAERHLCPQPFAWRPRRKLGAKLGIRSPQAAELLGVVKGDLKHAVKLLLHEIDHALVTSLNEV